MRILAVIFSLLFFTNANAATYTYHYQGALLDVITDDPYGIGAIDNGYSATLILDEALLGQSLKSANIHFQFAGPLYPGGTSSGPVQGILGFVVNHVNVLNTVAGANFWLQTDSAGNIISGLVDWLDGPPDGSFGATKPNFQGLYDWIDNSDYTVGSSRPGNWTTVAVSGEPFIAPVPLPAAAWMLIAGFLSLVMIGRRGKL